MRWRTPGLVKQDVPGIRNFAKIETTVACAGAITPGAIPEIKKMGYASIINLRLATEEGADIDKALEDATALGLTNERLKQFFLAPIQQRKR